MRLSTVLSNDYFMAKGSKFNFGPVEKKNFDYIKETISTKMSLVSYDSQLKTRIYHDACETGLAYVVMQKHENVECWCKAKENKCICR